MDGVGILDLKKFFIFQSMEETEIAEFLGYCAKVECFDGHQLFSEKDYGETMNIIIKGSVDIVRQDKSVIVSLQEGDFFGEVALFDYTLRTAGAIARGDTILIEIHRSDFNKLFMKTPKIAAKLLYQMMTEMSRRLRIKNSPGGGLIF